MPLKKKIFLLPIFNLDVYMYVYAQAHYLLAFMRLRSLFK